MAYLHDETKCLECGHTYRPISNDGSLRVSGCPKCAKAEAELHRHNHFEQLDAMSFEERIRRIEEVLYNQQITRHLPLTKF